MAESSLPPGVTAPKTPRAARGQGASSKPRVDRAPRTSEPLPQPKAEVTDAELTHRLAELLSAPAFVFKFGIHCDECANHFRDNGPGVAKALVDYAKNSPALRGVLLRITAVYGSIELFPILVMYFGFPVVHHGPDNLQPLAPFLGVPKREIKEHVHDADSSATAGTFTPPVQPAT